MQSERLVVLNPDGSASAVTISVAPKGSLNDLMAEFAAQSSITILNAGYTGQRTPASVVRHGADRYTVFAPVLGLRLDTRFKSERGVLIPVFRDASGSTQAVGHWSPPSTMKLWLIVTATFGSANRVFTGGYAYLIAVRPGSTGTYRLPLANVYNDGRLCLGRDNLPPVDTLVGAWDTANQALQNAPWNGDLADLAEPEHVGKLFQFDSSTMKNKPVSDRLQWENHCSRVANTVYDTLPLTTA